MESVTTDATEPTPTPTRGVKVTLDRVRHLRYSFGTRKKMMAAFGGEEEFRKNFSGDRLPEVLWYGLKHEDPSLTVEDVEELLDMQNMAEVVECMGKAMGYKGAKVEVVEAPVPEGNASALPDASATPSTE